MVHPGYDNNGRLPESATGRSGWKRAASLTSAIPRRNFAELLTDSNVREPDEEAVSAESYGEGLKGGIANKGAPGRVPFVSAYPMSGGLPRVSTG